MSETALAPVRLGDHFEITPAGLTVKGKPSFEQCSAMFAMLMRLREIVSGSCDPAASYRGSGVYALLNPQTLAAYIGSSVNVATRHSAHIRELKKGRHINQHLQRAWDKYGGVLVAFVLERTSRERDALLEAEQRWMDLWGELYNATPIAGRPHGGSLSDEHRQKISDALKGRKKTPEQIERHRLKMIGRVGRPMTQDHKERLRAINSSLTRPLELRARISTALTGKTQSEATKAKRSDSLRKHYEDEANRHRIRDNTKRGWGTSEIRQRRIAGIKAWASSPEGRANGVASAAKRWAGHSKERPCAFCGQIFTYKKTQQHTCSPTCAHKLAWRSRREKARCA